MANLGTTLMGSLSRLIDKGGADGLFVTRYLGNLEHGYGKADSSSHNLKEAAYWF